MRTVAAYWAALARTTANAHVHQAPRVTVPVFRDEPEAARADDGRGITAIAADTGEGLSAAQAACWLDPTRE